MKGFLDLFNHVGRRFVATEAEGALQQPKNRGETGAKSSEILKGGEDKTGRLFMIVRC